MVPTRGLYVLCVLTALLCIYATVAYASDLRCLELQVPRVNIEHQLVGLHQLDQIPTYAREICERHQLPAYKCKHVKKTLHAAAEDMAVLGATESLVNLTLDHRLEYMVAIDEATEQEQSATIVLFPEEPLSTTVALFCDRFALPTSSCDTLLSLMHTKASDEWGCQRYEEDPARILLPLHVDGIAKQFELRPTQDLDAEVANACLEWRLSLDHCGQLHDIITQMRVNRTITSPHSPFMNATVAPSIQFTSPDPMRVYPVSERVYVELERMEEDDEEICVYADFSVTPSYCGPVPLTTPVFFVPHRATLGHHLLTIRRKPLPEADTRPPILAARHFKIVRPHVHLLELETRLTENKQLFLNALVETVSFRLMDPHHRICTLHDASFQCFDPTQVQVVEEHPTDHRLRLRLPVFEASAGPHALSVLLLNEYNKCFAMTRPLDLTIRLDEGVTPLANQPSFFLNALAPPTHQPCPMEEMQWICDLWQHEWGLYSQNGEDGVLQSIFHHIGIQHQYYVEFGTEDGMECNTRLWRDVFQWKGLLMDGRFENASINLHQEWIDAENINELFTKYQVPSEFDLLSIDLDLNDYRVLNALDFGVFKPRVVVMEVNSHIPPTEAKTVAYNATGIWDSHSSYFGASVAAFHQWALEHQYTLVYCESHGVNCFFIENEALAPVVYNSTAALAWLHPTNLQRPPNFFGRGIRYPVPEDEKGDQWVWV